MLSARGERWNTTSDMADLSGATVREGSKVSASCCLM